MKKNSILLAAFLLMGALAPQRALADEQWSTEEYDVVYQDERNQTAIWTYGDGVGTIFIDGLAGVYTDRGSYSGYWVQEFSSMRCDTFREDANGEPTYYWGRFEITFVDPDFPSRWQAMIGLCDRKATIPLNGTPITPM
ncbi:MAG: hypothetical protein KTR27_19005 [Leptolyngbyaceae cyanobacterium MAG.088]|nr:hypothetical protein [Leptolyngbyaceae cyanobacterium MAG.088]